MAQDVHYLVQAEDACVRIDAYLGARDGMPSRSACAKLIEAGAVTLNGEACLSKKYIVQAGDRISA
ncbi:S4 domain-containing protein, partial [Collinsella sp. D33t1_170424_A12]